MIETWWKEFVVEHRKLHPAMVLPEPEGAVGAVLFRAWLRAFKNHGVTDYDVAIAASERMVLEPAKTRSLHLVTLIKHAQAIGKSKSTRSQHDLSTREGALEASKGCERCGGCGLTTVWEPEPSREAKRPPAVAAYCVCAYGRWVRGNHQAKSPDVFRRVPDLAEVIAGRSRWLVEAPSVSLSAPY